MYDLCKNVPKKQKGKTICLCSAIDTVYQREDEDIIKRYCFVEIEFLGIIGLL